MTKILVVEDDDLIRERLGKALGYEGYEVTLAENGLAALACMDLDLPDLVIADVLMPEMGGADFVANLRSRAETRVIPIIMVTALSERLSQREFMELGVDDYLTKPFHMEELLRAVRTQLRKMQWWEEDHRPVRDARMLAFANWRLDVERRNLENENGDHRALTNSELKVLLAFLHNANRVLSRDALVEHLGRQKAAPGDRGIDVLIGRLRRKIEINVKHPKIIETIRSGGYIFNGEVRVFSEREE
ncbi:MAG: response regulator transcription factor [Pseudomonadota bacterium]